MNIIIYGYTAKNFLPLLDRIFKNDFFENIFYIGTDEHIMLNNKNVIVFDWKKIRDCVYPDLISFPPLDQVIINEFQDCECICMKMFDRLENYSSYYNNMSYEKRKNYYLHHLHFWYSLINQYNIEYYIGQNFPHEIYDWIIYSIIKKKNGNILCSVQIEYLSRVLFVNDIFEIGNFESKTSNLNINNEVMNYYNNKKQLSFAYKKPFYMQNKLMSKYIKKYNKYAEKPDYNLKYVYVPLHYQPELTSCPLAKEYVKQELILQLLDYYLPNDIYIFIKEHPIQSQLSRNKISRKREKITEDKINIIKLLKIFIKVLIGRENINIFLYNIYSFFNKYLLKYFNISFFKSNNEMLLSSYNIKSKGSRIKFIKTNIDSQELIYNSIAVVTCTGTSAIEALIKEKPVLIFGNYIYDFAPGVKKIINNNDMMNAYDFIKSFSFNENKLLDYLQTLYDNTHNLIVDKMYEKNINIDYTDNNEKLYNIIYNFLHTIK